MNDPEYVADFNIAPPGTKLTEYTNACKKDADIQRKNAFKYWHIEKEQYPRSQALGKNLRTANIEEMRGKKR